MGSLFLFSAILVLPFGQDTSKQMEQTIRDFVEAFNKHDVDAMLTYVSDDLFYMFVSGDQIAVETKTKAALAKSMDQYFKQLPSARSEIEGMMIAGQYATVQERAHWQAKSGPKSQMALAVYQFKDGKIHRVWYYPAQQ